MEAAVLSETFDVSLPQNMCHFQKTTILNELKRSELVYIVINHLLFVLFCLLFVLFCC
jgi:hypothetical protein